MGMRIRTEYQKLPQHLQSAITAVATVHIGNNKG
jgi:hypothetical protein